MQEQIANSHEAARAAKRQLMLRGAGAAALVLALLGALVMLDRKSEPSEEPAVTARTVTPPSPRVEAPESAPLADSAREMVAQSADAPEASAASLSSAPLAAASAPQGVPEETSDPTAPVLGVPGKAPAPARPAAAPSTTPPATSPVPRLTLGTEPAKAASGKPDAKQAIIKDGFVVQMGVFSDYGNAEQLYKKLTTAGISAHMETRVQVGPFKTRQEALAAQAQLKKLGLANGMVVPSHPAR